MNEHKVRWGSRKEQRNQDVRDGNTAGLDSLNLLSPRDAIGDYRLVDNEFSLSTGEFGGFTVRTPGMHVKGVGAGSRIVRPVRVTETCVFDGVHFIATEDTGPMVSIDLAATVMFRNCIFEKRVTDTESYVDLVLATCQATFTACWFKGATGAAGNHITAPAGAPWAFITTVGCMRENLINAYVQVGNPNYLDYGSF